MVELDFAVVGASPEPYALSPTLRFSLIAATRGEDPAVHNVSLQCQIRIDAARRGYGPREHDSLRDLFGDKARWGETLHSFLWVQVPGSIPAFTEKTRFDLLVPCSFDFNIAATKYFHGLSDGEVPLSLLFSGSVFYRDADGALQIGQISWSRETAYRLPVRVWQAMMEHYYPDGAWLHIGRDTFEKLYRLKRLTGAPTFEHALESLLAGGAMEPVS
jgi:hypothetical protein